MGEWTVILYERNMGYHKRDRDAHVGYRFLIALRDHSFDNYVDGLVSAFFIVAYAKPSAGAK